MSVKKTKTRKQKKQLSSRGFLGRQEASVYTSREKTKQKRISAVTSIQPGTDLESWVPSMLEETCCMRSSVRFKKFVFGDIAEGQRFGDPRPLTCKMSVCV